MGFGNGRTTTKWVGVFDDKMRYETARDDLGEDVWPYIEDVRVYKVTKTLVHFVHGLS